MPRIPRLYRVLATYRNGETATRHYQTPEAANERRLRFEAGRPALLSEEAKLEWETANPDATAWPLDIPTVTVTPSHPVTYPHAAGDASMFEIPDTVFDHVIWRTFLVMIGLSSDAEILSITPDGDGITVTYTTNPKHAPHTWRAEFVRKAQP